MLLNHGIHMKINAGKIAPFSLKQQGENCDFSGNYFWPSKNTGTLKLRHSAALWYGSRRGHFSPRNLPASVGPEPWKVAYVQPSRRPTDGRYGENPNRLQLLPISGNHEPSPVNIQNSTLIRSRVSALIPLITTFALSRTTGNLRHWAPGAWAGVWLDGMEISQFT